MKKSLLTIINEEIPSLKVSSVGPEDTTIYYDAYAMEEDVERLKILLKGLSVELKIERRVF